MADAVVNVRVDVSQLKAWAGGVDKRFREMRRDLLTPLGDVLVQGVRGHFDQGGVDGKAWKPLARATLERRMGQAQIKSVTRARRRLQAQHGPLGDGLLARTLHRQVQPKAGLLSFVEERVQSLREGEDAASLEGRRTFRRRRDRGTDLLSPPAERALRKKLSSISGGGSMSAPSHLKETGSLQRSIKRKTLMGGEQKGTLLIYSDDPKAAVHDGGAAIDHPGAKKKMVFNWTNRQGEGGLWIMTETQPHTIRIPRRRFMAWDADMKDEARLRIKGFLARAMEG